MMSVSALDLVKVALIKTLLEINKIESVIILFVMINMSVMNILLNNEILYFLSVNLR